TTPTTSTPDTTTGGTKTDTPTESTGTDTTPPDQTVDETDLTTYSQSKQTVGDSTNKKEYTLKSITDTTKTTYHNFVFTLDAKSTDTTVSPYVVVNYSSSLGAIRVDLNGVTIDQSGIGYQKSRNIDKEGVIRLYHNVSADSTEELYDIGVSKSTPFKVFVTENGANSWKVTVDVVYPGGNTTSESYGSSDFSKELQALDGCVAPDSCKVSAYSYSTSGGVLSIIFTVSGTTSRPTPAADAKYNASSKLELTFLGLSSDGIYASMNNKTIGGITITTSRVGTKSVYTFNGASKEYRLSATKSPNQVLLEIKL
ncbi:MAG TPA: hypothetical protein VHA74_03965, partial [Candidatus Dojkabacteria bacterium]|nr:hypothetical protein [Candidatus Dojkabacteria bacterium]